MRKGTVFLIGNDRTYACACNAMKYSFLEDEHLFTLGLPILVITASDGEPGCEIQLDLSGGSGEKTDRVQQIFCLIGRLNTRLFRNQ